MKLTAERKRLLFLVGTLAVLGGYSFYSNVLSGPSSAPASSQPGPRPSRPAAKTGAVRPATPAGFDTAPETRRPSSARSGNSEEFRPSLKPKRPEDRVDPMTIDPTLRLDLLAKVQAVSLEGGHRNLFAVGAPPLPPEPTVVAKAGGGPKPNQIGPQPEPPPPPKPTEPPPPPISLKYYGYSSARGDNHKRAFFLDGEDILVAAEGETVKKRYRVVRIGVNSVVMEDTQYKHEQTLPLQEDKQVAG